MATWQVELARGQRTPAHRRPALVEGLPRFPRLAPNLVSATSLGRQTEDMP
jgi:hypothetical protein